ncbi:hypothetical protein CLAVI_000507 [Candidatus Clavichlamydia salmonicola]|uniref:hypothetical protein n=1 Tax=Candidatus Clavichlamydia salmonicola TaxID=469812 RepID=UPI0018911D05|nr:hypothetical protein [Candidatus Clavichlamydia salmonicola]MBF5050885.1 hypothetical protein [Candidatus Clavichlamydia salmonicola]
MSFTSLPSNAKRLSAVFDDHRSSCPQLFHTIWNTKLNSKIKHMLYAIGTIVFHTLTIGIPLFIHHLLKHNLCHGIGYLPHSDGAQKKINNFPVKILEAQRLLNHNKQIRKKVHRTNSTQLPFSTFTGNHKKIRPPHLPFFPSSFAYNPYCISPQTLPFLKKLKITPINSYVATLTASVHTSLAKKSKILTPEWLYKSLESLKKQQKMFSHNCFQKEILNMSDVFQAGKAPVNAYQMLEKLQPGISSYKYVNKNFSGSYPYSIKIYANQECPVLMTPIHADQDMDNSQSIRALATQKQIALLDKNFLVCQVQGDGMCFFRAFIISWLISLSQKVSIGNSQAFIDAAQFILSQKDFIASSTQAAALSTTASSIVLQAGKIENPTAIMEKIVLEKKYMMPLIHYFRSLSTFLHMHNLEPDALIATLLAADNDFIDQIWIKLQINPITAPLLIETFNLCYTEEKPCLFSMKEFIEAAFNHPAGWSLTPILCHFLPYILEKANCYLDAKITATFAKLEKIIKQNKYLKHAYKEFCSSFNGYLLPSPGILFCFLKHYLAVMPSEHATICSNFLLNYENNCIKPIIKALKNSSLISIYPPEKNIPFLQPALEKVIILKSIYDDIKKHLNFYDQFKLIIKDFFVDHSNYLETEISAAYTKGLISLEDYHLYKQLNRHSPLYKAVAANFKQFYIQAKNITHNISFPLKFLIYLQQNQSIMTNEPSLQTWFNTAQRLHQFAEHNTSDFIAPPKISIQYFLSVINQLAPFSKERIQKIKTTSSLKEKNLLIFMTLGLQIEATFSSLHLRHHYIKFQNIFNQNIIKHWPQDPFHYSLYLSALEALADNDHYQIQWEDFCNNHSEAVSQSIYEMSPNSGNSTKIEYYQLLFSFLTINSAITESHLSEDHPFHAFMIPYTKAYTLTAQNISWELSSKDMLMLMDECNEKNSLLLSHLLHLNPVRKKLNTFFKDDPILIPLFRQIQTDALNEKKGQAEADHVQIMTSKFTPFSLCQGVWDPSNQVNGKTLDQINLNLGFIGGGFVPPNLTDGGVHILRSNNHYSSLIPKPKTIS